jgi:hypothetical protein
MSKLHAKLDALGKSLGIQRKMLARAQRKVKARHKAQKKTERARDAARKSADRLRAEGRAENAVQRDETVARLDRQAHKRESEAIVWKGRVKVLTQRVNGLATTQQEVEGELKKWQSTHAPHIGKDGRVAGAKDHGEAAIFAARYIASKCASGDRPNYYSMTGVGFNCKHPLLRGSQRAIGQVPYERSDCSLFVTEVCWAAKLPDPNGENYGGGYTGTLVGEHNGWKFVSEAHMKKKGWGIVVYGEGVGHHTEFYVGEGGEATIGHGSPPVDEGIVNLFGDGDFRCLIYDPS